MGRKAVKGEYQAIIVFLVMALILDQKFNLSGGGRRRPPWS
jgi:hypothetical protein